MQFTDGLPRTTLVAVLLVLATLPQRGYAHEPPPSTGQKSSASYVGQYSSRVQVKPAVLIHGNASGVIIGAAALVNPLGGGLELDVRYRFFSSAMQLGLLVNGQAASNAFFGGTKAEGVASSAVKAIILIPILVTPSVEFDVRLMTGVTYARDVWGSVTPYRDSLRSATDLAWLAHVPLGDVSLLRVGAVVGVDIEMQPTQSLADQAALLTVGFGRKVTQSALFYASVEAGGTYGFDGDNGKVVTRGSLGVRWSWANEVVLAF
jgi:hypothetical protein